MAKTKLVTKESKRSDDLKVMEVEFVKDLKNIKKGTKVSYGIDTAVDLVLKGFAKMTQEKGKKVMNEVEDEEIKFKERAEAIKAKKKNR